MPPSVVVHADWSTGPRKRVAAVARLLPEGRYAIDAPRRVGRTGSPLARLGVRASSSTTALVGFDFPIGVPIGVPAAYAQRAGISSFRDALVQFGAGEWRDFYSVCTTRSEIDIRRPFYPYSCPTKGACKREHLEEALEVSWRELLRLCERGTEERRAACPLFWTLGGNQVGKAAISGWREFVQPMLSAGAHVGLWPFDGPLADLLRSRSCVIVETYPTEFYGHLDLKFASGKGQGKRSQSARKRLASRLLEEAEALDTQLFEDARDAVTGGFGPHGDGEDAFDAMVGLLGMLKHLHTGLHVEAPADPAIDVEGWIVGQKLKLGPLRSLQSP